MAILLSVLCAFSVFLCIYSSGAHAMHGHVTSAKEHVAHFQSLSQITLGTYSYTLYPTLFFIVLFIFAYLYTYTTNNLSFGHEFRPEKVRKRRKNKSRAPPVFSVIVGLFTNEKKYGNDTLYGAFSYQPALEPHTIYGRSSCIS